MHLILWFNTDAHLPRALGNQRNEEEEVTVRKGEGEKRRSVEKERGQ